ncbi:hypothetical protein BZA05DRAFT_436044 [Tricharina praecox]|uniref:uncharacterized protein n=1 Tax=Tricharina praecox TaxID=43433 RepID=UPI00221FC672|nr:uncharacterized protein BZA05DRAFT_436044 [Tricharina praecox]KAI5852161.1 hypothetical protein BZA05DRAFT_436044 [Tricharina praecox]
MKTLRGKRKAPSTPESSSIPQAKRSRKPPATAATSTSVSGSSSSRRPRKRDLAELPYHVLLEIFLYAAQRGSTSNSGYLLKLATMCKGFYEPAITALYRMPLTEPPIRAHQLQQALQRRPELGRKVKYLYLEVDPLLRLMTPGYGHFDLAELVSKCTGLRELWLAHYLDRPPYRYNDIRLPTFKYPDALFDVLQGAPGTPKEDAIVEGGGNALQKVAPIRLSSWRWNGLFLAGWTVQSVTRIHLLPSFQTLKRLSVIYMWDPGFDFVSALGVLPAVEEIELECCDFTPQALSQLPIQMSNFRLKSLSFINCRTLESDALMPLLLSPICAGLESLTIVHCRMCNLAFLPTLSNTPRLRQLSYDCRYFASGNGDDAKPGYDSLLPISTEAVWPDSLCSLKLLNLRKWNADEVEAFLDGLLAAAPNLPRMREFSLHCILDDLGWRERANVRDKYEPQLIRAFVRPSSQPQPIFRLASPSPPKESSDVDSKLRRSKRVRGAGTAQSPKTTPQKDAEKAGEDADQKLHGFCEPDRVDIKMDNARPTETQFDEGDFLEGRAVAWPRPRTAGARSGRGRGGGRGRGQRHGSGRRGNAAGSSASRAAARNEGVNDSSDEDYVE